MSRLGGLKSKVGVSGLSVGGLGFRSWVLGCQGFLNFLSTNDPEAHVGPKPRDTSLYRDPLRLLVPTVEDRLGP